MGTSIIGQLVKIYDGLIFQEGFENGNFVQADGWSIVQGNPTASLNQSLQGLKSFQCTGTGSSLSIISKTFPVNYNINYSAGSGTPRLEVYFYDDLTSNRNLALGPYLKVKGDANTNEYFCVGVRNNVSTSNYVCSTTTADDDLTHVTSVSRSPGWHRFDVTLNPVAHIGEIKVDGATQLSTSGIASNYIQTIYLCSGMTSDTNGTFGYFDSMSLQETTFLQIDGLAGRTVTFYDPSYNIINQSAVSPGVPFFTVNFPSSSLPFPALGYVTVSQLTNAANVEFQSPLLSINNGDIYAYQSIDFGRKFVSPQPTATALQVQNPSQGGNVEVLTLGYKDKFKGDIKALQGTSWDYLLRNWFATARQGTPFSVLTDSNSCVFSPITANALPGQPAVTGLFNNGIQTGTPATGPYYILEDMSKKNKQRVTVASTNGTGPYTITFNETLQFPITANQFYLRDQYFFPFMELDQPYDLSGLRWSDARNLLSDFTLSARDYVAT